MPSPTVRRMSAGDVAPGARANACVPAPGVDAGPERTLRGEAGPTLTLEFVGGTIGERRLEVAGWPAFEVGDRGVFFVENRQARMCPIVRLRHGRYRIVGEGGALSERVVRDDYSPVEATLDVAVPLAERSGPARAAAGGGMGLAEFEGRIAMRSAAFPRPERSR